MPKYDDRKIRELAEKLKGTTANVYDVAPGVLGVPAVGSSVYRALKDPGGVFQCDCCDAWKPLSEMTEVPTAKYRDWCQVCVEADKEEVWLNTRSGP